MLSDLKNRTELDYGLKYEIITISNRNATAVSSKSSSTGHPFSVPNTSAIPLSLTLNKEHDITTLIRCDFSHNYRCCSQSYGTNTDMTGNAQFLWQWFDCKFLNNLIGSFALLLDALNFSNKSIILNCDSIEPS